MSLKVYRDTILKPVVGEWLRRGDNFVLEENNDSGYGISKKNIVRTWKEQNNLTYFFNLAELLDIPPIEKAWNALNKSVKKQPFWDNRLVIEAAEDGWRGLK